MCGIHAACWAATQHKYGSSAGICTFCAMQHDVWRLSAARTHTKVRLWAVENASHYRRYIEVQLRSPQNV
jgi:hypothetical protein